MEGLSQQEQAPKTFEKNLTRAGLSLSQQSRVMPKKPVLSFVSKVLFERIQLQKTPQARH